MGEEVRTLPSPLGLSDFDLGVTLGTGSFGRVRFVTHKVSRRPVYGQKLVRPSYGGSMVGHAARLQCGR